jgi:hypothetical protein
LVIKWGAQRPWLRNISADEAVTVVDDLNVISTLEHASNGFLYVVPFTQLQSPDGSDVGINIYVSSDNMEVNATTTQGFFDEREIYTESYSRVINTESYVLRETCVASNEIGIYDLNPSTANKKGINDHFFGEQILSFRTLLKRVMTTDYDSYSMTSTGGTTLVLIRPIFPDNNMPYGAFTGIIDHFSYLRLAYLGARGGIRVKFRANIGDNPHPMGQVKVTLQPAGTVQTTSDAHVTIGQSFSHWEGTASFVPSTNGSIEVEFPFYSNNYFFIPLSSGLNGGMTGGQMENTWFRTFKIEMDLFNTSGSGSLSFDRSAAEDFSFLRFLGAPSYSVT